MLLVSLFNVGAPYPGSSKISETEGQERWSFELKHAVLNVLCCCVFWFCVFLFDSTKIADNSHVLLRASFYSALIDTTNCGSSATCCVFSKKLQKVSWCESYVEELQELSSLLNQQEFLFASQLCPFLLNTARSPSPPGRLPDPFYSKTTMALP